MRQKQYPMKLEAWVGLEPIINNFLKYGLLQECQSEYNTLILPVKKPHSQKNQLVQDLRTINQIATDVHPVVPNPYTPLTIVDSNVYFTVGLKRRLLLHWMIKVRNCLRLNRRGL